MRCEFCARRLAKDLVQIGARSYCTVECHREMRHAQDEASRPDPDPVSQQLEFPRFAVNAARPENAIGA